MAGDLLGILSSLPISQISLDLPVPVSPVATTLVPLGSSVYCTLWKLNCLFTWKKSTRFPLSTFSRVRKSSFKANFTSNKENKQPLRITASLSESDEVSHHAQFLNAAKK